MLPHRFFPGEGVTWQQLQAHMLHSFPGFKSNLLEIPVIPRSKGTVYLTPGIHQESLLTVSFCVLYTYAHWNQHGFFLFVFWCLVCWGFFPSICCFFLFCSPCWENILQKPRVSTPQVILNISQTSQKSANLMCSEILSCQVANCRIPQI